LDEKLILFHLWKGKVELDVRGLWDEKVSFAFIMKWVERERDVRRSSRV
jgi:hypothetical protein